MDQNTRLEPPTPADDDDLRITEATSVPEYSDVGAATLAAAQPTTDPYANTATRVVPVVEPAARVVQSVQSVQPVQPVAYASAPPLQTQSFGEVRQPAWPYIAAVIALVVGGVVGFLIGTAGDDDPAPTAAPAADTEATFDVLLTRTQEDGEYLTPSEYPQLDEITAIDNAAATRDLQTEVDMLTAAQEETAGLTDQVAALEAALLDVTTERDALVAGNTEGTTDQQADLDAANDQIAALTAELDTARADLEAANATLAQTEASLETAVEERDAANETITALDVTPAPNYVNGAVTKARSDASANGWTLIEQTELATVAPGTVITQTPAEKSNMIKGSVLYVTVAGTP